MVVDRRIRARGRLVALLCTLLCAACGGGGGDATGTTAPTAATPGGGAGGGLGPGRSGATGAVFSTSTAPAGPVDLPFHAAARFLEQASFGATPTTVEALKGRDLGRWIDEQMALPASRIDSSAIRDSRFDEQRQFDFVPTAFHRLALTAPDQLRLRTSWALVQLLVVSQSRVSGFAMAEYFNLLQRGAFGSYRDLLRTVTLHPSMGFFQDNASNRRAGAVPGATSNENYARELMQLFTIGLVELNADGSARTGRDGQPIATYTQKDVEELARALTGWEFDTDSAARPPTDFGNFASPMRANPFWHDDGTKRLVGGRTIPAGGTPATDLEAVLDVLTGHPNHAPFVSRRLIQHFVTGDPSAAYVARIAAVFRDTGGDLGRVVRAVLLDPDARRGDDPSAPAAIRGKVKEPILARVQWLRAFGCRDLPAAAGDPALWTPGQPAFTAPTVFNFYPPDFRIPGTTLLAPEFKLLTAQLLQERANETGRRVVWSNDSGRAWTAAGCETAPWLDAQERGPEAVLDLLSRRFLRGAMPAYLSDAISIGVLDRTWNRDSRVFDAVSLVLTSPAWGVMK